MKNYGISFELRFRTQLAGHEFLSEVSCADSTEASSVCAKMACLDQDVELVAALVYIDTSHAGGCDVLDDESMSLFTELCLHLRVAPETFYNQRLGSYDRWQNSITPADMGHHFPDGTLRIVWELESARLDVDETVRILKGAAELLAEMEEIPYFCQSDVELEDNNWTALVERRMALLFAAGCWPAEDDSFEEVDKPSWAELLQERRITTA